MDDYLTISDNNFSIAELIGICNGDGHTYPLRILDTFNAGYVDIQEDDYTVDEFLMNQGLKEL